MLKTDSIQITTEILSLIAKIDEFKAKAARAQTPQQVQLLESQY